MIPRHHRLGLIVEQLGVRLVVDVGVKRYPVPEQALELLKL